MRVALFAQLDGSPQKHTTNANPNFQRMVRRNSQWNYVEYVMRNTQQKDYMRKRKYGAIVPHEGAFRTAGILLRHEPVIVGIDITQ